MQKKERDRSPTLAEGNVTCITRYIIAESTSRNNFFERHARVFRVNRVHNYYSFLEYASFLKIFCIFMPIYLHISQKCRTFALGIKQCDMPYIMLEPDSCPVFYAMYIVYNLSIGVIHLAPVKRYILSLSHSCIGMTKSLADNIIRNSYLTCVGCP